MSGKQNAGLGETFFAQSRITRGQGPLGRIYDRLRKRSQRRLRRADLSWDIWWDDQQRLEPLEENEPEDMYAVSDHAAYVAGLHDALYAVQAYLNEGSVFSRLP